MSGAGNAPFKSGWAFRQGIWSPLIVVRKHLRFGDSDGAEGTSWADFWFEAAAGGQTAESAAPLTGAGAITANGRKETSSAAPLTGAGNVIALGRKESQGSAPLSGAGALTANGQKQGQSGASLTTTGNVTASGSAALATPEGKSGAARLAASSSWNVNRVSDMLASVRQLLGRVEIEAKKPKAGQGKIEIPKAIAATVATKKPAKPAIDFVPVRVSLADLDASRLVSELRALEARLDRLDKRLAEPAPKRAIDPIDEDEYAALILLGMPAPKLPRHGIAIDDDDLAAILLAA